jgi:hypothetical protein
VVGTRRIARFARNVAQLPVNRLHYGVRNEAESWFFFHFFLLD